MVNLSASVSLVPACSCSPTHALSDPLNHREDGFAEEAPPASALRFINGVAHSGAHFPWESHSPLPPWGIQVFSPLNGKEKEKLQTLEIDAMSHGNWHSLS